MHVFVCVQDPEVRCQTPVPPKSAKSKTKLWPNAESDNQLRGDLLAGSWTDLSGTKLKKTGIRKSGPFQPKNLTFNFSQQARRPVNHSSTPILRRITPSSLLEFTDFVDLFKAFMIQMRKDIREIFRQLLLLQSRKKQSEHVQRLNSAWKKPSGKCVLFQSTSKPI